MMVSTNISGTGPGLCSTAAIADVSALGKTGGNLGIGQTCQRSKRKQQCCCLAQYSIIKQEVTRSQGKRTAKKQLAARHGVRNEEVWVHLEKTCHHGATKDSVESFHLIDGPCSQQVDEP